MRVTPINSAEAVFEPFFDEHLSEFDQWKVDAPGALGVNQVRGWAFIVFQWTLPAPDGLVHRLRRTYAEPVPCANYDRLLVCFSVPDETVMTITAETDAGERRRVGPPAGARKREEWVALDGAREIRALTIELHSPRRAAGSGWLLWIGLQHTARVQAYLDQWAGYDERWAKYLQPPHFEPKFEPSYGFMITAAELEEVRRAYADSPVTEELRFVGERARRQRPESMIGENLNYWSFHGFRRERDNGKMLSLHGAFAAQAGLLWKDRELCRLAARFAISLVHCDYWEDSFFGHMRGSTWEQRGGVAAIGSWDCAVILDLCGEWFTPLGRQLVLRRLAIEAHGRMCQASWWWEYMYHTNQLAWISPSRIYSLLVLERNMPVNVGPYPAPTHSRVAPHTDIAWANLVENIGLAVSADGGYLEGTNYFTWTARQAILCAFLYARGRGQDPRPLVPPALLGTDRYAEMLYSTDEGQETILTGDAVITGGEGTACLAWLMPQSHWVNILRKQLRRVGAAPFLFTLRLAREVPAEGPPLSPFLSLPATAMMCSVRRLGPELVKLFILGNKAGSDHQHEDKGSFVLEGAGDSFAFDYGMLDYANPAAELVKHAQRHNMLTPWSDDERPKPQSPCYVDLPPEGTGDERQFHASLELHLSWPGWFRQWRRTWDSPAPDTFVITDDWAVERGRGVLFHWTTQLPMRLERDRVVIEGRRAVAEIAIPAGVEAVVEQLPLQDPRRTAVEQDRRDIIQFGWKLAATQPRLTLRQAGASGRLQVAVKLRLKSAATASA